MFEHEKLAVYHKAVAVAIAMRGVADAIPHPCGDLRSQLRRAAASIPLNLAEGASEWQPAEKRRIYRIARRSAGECAAILDLLAAYVRNPARVAEIKAQLNEVVALLTRLINAQPEER